MGQFVLSGTEIDGDTETSGGLCLPNRWVSLFSQVQRLTDIWGARPVAACVFQIGWGQVDGPCQIYK